MKKPKAPSVAEQVVAALGIRGAVHALDAARWRLRVASLEPGRSNNQRFVCAAAELADVELAKVIHALLKQLDPQALAELEHEREQCAAVRERRWKSPAVAAEVYQHPEGESP